MAIPRLRADFNGLFEAGKILCLSHSDICTDDNGLQVSLRAGMLVTAYDEDMTDGVMDDIIATGIVEPSPDWLQCRGSRWILRIDDKGVRHQSDIKLSD